jgi:uncharacterized protein (TIGR03435 family)
LQEFIKKAYRVDDFQITGGPNWLDSDGFVVEASAGRAATHEELVRMLQSLLAERFGLTLHRESKDMSIYALVVAKNGPKIHELKEGDPIAIPKQRPGTAVWYTNGDVHDFAAFITRVAGRPVIDKTGLKGRYAIWLEKDPDEDLFTAVEENLGLKLEPQRAPVEIIVIDRAEHPSAN